ncbi:MAG: potassium transporter TrkA [Deltaproteobacteria bacterium]|nr:potassium transporter TrkA [Deltaproteobacteria bacterium]
MSFSLRERARYAFDNTLAKGTVALIAWLAVVSLLGILLIAALVVLFGVRPEGAEELGFAEAAWGNLMRTLDAGTMGGDEGWPFRIWMFLVTLLGIFILSTLIGVLSSGLEGQLDALRKGRSRVVEHDHTVILGWSEQVFPIIAELIEANASRRRACIVVLGEKDKVEMEEAIAEAIDDTRTTRIVCRNGSPRALHDLHIAGIDSARSIIVVAPENEEGEKSPDPDVDVIKALLAITNNPNRKPSPYHIVAEVRDPKNFAVAQMVGKDEVELVLVGDLVARVMAQTCRQSGLSVVYTELLDFGGDEIYFKEEPSLVGKSYSQALLAYEDCAVIGMRQRGGAPVLNPPPDTPIAAGDKLIVVAEDDDAIKLGTAPAPANAAAIVAATEVPATPERSLILGWNWRAPSVINELDNYVPPGSTIHVVADAESAEETIRTECSGLKRQKLQFRRADTTDRRVLDALKVQAYDHVIVLCYSDTLDVQKADAITLITLLHLRDIADKANHRIPVVSEMLDIKNRALAEVTRADDFIVSDKLVSLMLSQISENKELNLVFADLFSSEGSEIYLKPATQYVTPNVPVTFSTVVVAAARRGESALGFKLAAQSGDASKSYGVVVNPEKSESVTFGPHDKIIVLAED